VAQDNNDIDVPLSIAAWVILLVHYLCLRNWPESGTNLIRRGSLGVGATNSELYVFEILGCSGSNGVDDSNADRRDPLTKTGGQAVTIHFLRSKVQHLNWVITDNG
jgi:hypothetical protein